MTFANLFLLNLFYPKDPNKTNALRLRYKVEGMAKHTVFKPSDNQIQEGLNKHGVLGAALAGTFDGLPTGASCVAWDAKLDGAAIKPIKPKFWLLGDHELEPGLCYQLPDADA